MTNRQSHGEYDHALRADKDASATIRWAEPIIIFGWIIVGLASLVLVVAIVGGLFTLGRGGDQRSLAYGLGATTLASIGVALVMLLNASLVLVAGYSARMRGHWIKYQVGAALRGDN